MPLALAMTLRLAPSALALDTSPPSPPVVTDDGVYTATANSIHASWTGGDAQSGIAEYQYQIRRDSASGPLIADWTSVGAAQAVTRSGLALASGKRYYVVVKARNGAGLWSTPGASNGILVDLTAPSAPGIPKMNGSAAVAYDRDGTYTVSWAAVSDPESAIGSYEVQERPGPAAAWTTVSGAAASTSFTAANRPHGAYREYRVRARNRAGLRGAFSAASSPVVVDMTPPYPPAVIDGAAFTTSTTTLEASWSAGDDESPIVEYQYEIRRDSPAGGVVTSWASTGTAFGVRRTGLKLLHGVTYFIDVRARNAVGLWSQTGSSNGVQVDATPPTVPVVTDDGATQDSPSTLHAQWTASQDPESGVWGYEVAVGTTPGGADARDWTDVGGARESTQAGLTLSPGATYFVSVRARNGAGAHSLVGVTDGIRILIPPPPAPSHVRAIGRQLMLSCRCPDRPRPVRF